jgi:hypothetical protein
MGEAEKVRAMLLSSYTGYSQLDEGFPLDAMPEPAKASLQDEEFKARMQPVAMAETITDEQYALMSHLGDTPLTVIEAGKTIFPHKQWHDGQMQLVGMSNASRFILAEEFSHATMGTRGAGIVVQAVRDMIDEPGRPSPSE